MDTKYTMVKWHMDIMGLPPHLRGEGCVRPVALINSLATRQWGEHWKGCDAQGHNYYDNYSYLVNDKSINWINAKVYEQSIPIAHPMILHHAVMNGDFSKVDCLFGPDVAVGDMIVVYDVGVAYQPPVGFVCGEGNSWSMVILADDGDYFRYWKKQYPCIGKRYEKELEELVKQYKASHAA